MMNDEISPDPTKHWDDLFNREGNLIFGKKKLDRDKTKIGDY